MAFDTPARVAILGAGPIGLEAALYARYLGYDVDLYERGYLAENVRRWGHLRMYSPFGTLRSSLGLAAIRAQDPAWIAPADDELLSGSQWIERYLLPLSRTDLIEPHVHEQREVVAVGHEELRRDDAPATAARDEFDFQLLVRDSGGAERWSSADIVIDATGVFGNANLLGPGGLPSAGELASAGRIDYAPPDVLGYARPLYAGRRVLLAGEDYLAAATLLALQQLVSEAPDTTVHWATPPRWTSSEADFADTTAPAAALVESIGDEPDIYAQRGAVLAAARQLAVDPPPWLTCHRQALVRSLAWQPATRVFHVLLEGASAAEIAVDRIAALVGYRPSFAHLSELPIALDAASEAPARLAAALRHGKFDESRGPVADDADSLLASEPNFYVLGAKSYGRFPGFSYSAGLEQIRSLFSIIGERADLNLYATA